ncbi:MAG: diguanylate cyclase [Pirellulales bacterium]
MQLNVTPPATPQATPRVLVVDDDPDMLRLLAKWLTDEKYSVTLAADGQEALEVLRDGKPSIIITDWRMPRLNGLELCQSIRNDDQTRHSYVLFLTARTGPDEMLEALDAGADDFLAKPVDREQFLVRVRYAELALKRLERYAALAETDPLTGLLNRRVFVEVGSSQFRLAATRGRRLSCVLLDIDLFKHVNDTYGHSVGDAALQMVANLLRTHSRASDTVCRYGGDEFCVFLADMTEHDALRWAERIRIRISDMRLPVGSQEIRIRVTLGVAQMSDTTASLQQLVDMADQALLTAKHSGRDRALRYGALNDLEEFNIVGSRELQRRLAGVTAGQAMTTPLISLGQDEQLHEAADLFLRLRVNSVPIVDDQKKLVGIVSEKDLLNVTLSHESWDVPIRDVMKTSVICYDVETPLATIWEFLRRVAIRRVVIVKDGVPCGVISRGGLLRWVGNWGMIRSYRQSDDIKHGRNTCLDHLRKTSRAMEEAVEQFKNDLSDAHSNPVPFMINTASVMQQYVQDILAFSQIYYGFDPVTGAMVAPEPSHAGHASN